MVINFEQETAKRTNNNETAILEADVEVFLSIQDEIR